MLTFNYGSMGSGKTAALCSLYKDLIKQDKEVIVLAPFISTRNGFKISSRNGDKINDVISIGSGTDLYSKLCSKATTTQILIDESQFLTVEQVRQLKMLTELHNFNVQCYGLLTDHSVNMWDGSRELLIHADNNNKFHSRCIKCGKQSSYTIKKVNNNKQVEIGDAIYSSVCFEHTGLFI